MPPYPDGWNVLRSPPKTEWLDEQAELATAPWDDVFLEALENGFFEGGGKIVRLSEDRPTTVKVSELFEAYVEALGTAPYARNTASSKTMVLLLKKHLKAVKDKRRDGVYYIIPALNVLRAKRGGLQNPVQVFSVASDTNQSASLH